MSVKRVGLIVNPVAGIGGSVGLAGSDGDEIQREARARGGMPRAPGRAERFVRELYRRVPDALIATGHTVLGGEIAPEAELVSISGSADRPNVGTLSTSREDTVELAAELVRLGVHVLVFVGGDGTARDVLAGIQMVDPQQLCVGVPGGVKMHSGVFAITPEDAAAQVAEALMFDPGTVRSELSDVADLNEEERRRGRLHTDVFGAMRVPAHERVQRGKRSPMQGADSIDARGIAEVIAAQETGTLVFGPGTTVAAVATEFGVTGSLLGFDVLLPEGEIAVDVTGTELEQLTCDGNFAVVLSPIGGQGFIIGRGNHQLTETVLARLDPRRLIIVSGAAKLGELAGKLRVDAPTVELNDVLRGYRRVLLGAVDTAQVCLE